MAVIIESTSGDILSRRLANFTALQPEEIAAIAAAVSGPARSAKARHDLIREGEPPIGVFLVLSGWACRYKMLEDGRRQIVSFLVPGDTCDLHNTTLARMDHSIGAMTAVRYAILSNALLHRLSMEHPRVGQAFWWQMLVNVATQREWTMNIGQRNALERVGSLFCELMLRLRAVGLAGPTGFDFPLKQADIAEATGLTPVHVNRTLRHMRDLGVITLSGRVLTISDFAKLQMLSLYSPSYLHLGEERERGARVARESAGA